MKKYQIIIGCLFIALGLYFGLKNIDLNIAVKNDLPSQGITEKLLQEKFQEYENWGYGNGLAMPKRILGENEAFKKWGWNYDKDLTCEKVVDEMYELGQEKAIRPD